MTTKYKVVVIGYKNIDQRILDKISAYSVKEFKKVNDLDTDIINYCGKGFNMNNRLCIYLDWFKNEIKKQITDGYQISILELPMKTTSNKLEIIDFLNTTYPEDFIVLEKIEV